MGISGQRLTESNPKYGSKSLTGKPKGDDKISFSFLYYRQIDLFGIGNCSVNWHVGLIDRFTQLGSLSKSEITENNRGSKALRCHPINWASKNVPINRKDLCWLPAEILENEAEFPIVQLSISKGMGRIVGFFGYEMSVFYIVLLDPNHNIQPSKKHNHQIRNTTIGISQYDDLLSRCSQIKSRIGKCKHSTNCDLNNHIDSIKNENVIYLTLDDDFHDYYHSIEHEKIREVVESYILERIQEIS